MSKAAGDAKPTDPTPPADAGSSQDPPTPPADKGKPADTPADTKVTPPDKGFTQDDIDRAVEKAKKDAQKEIDDAAAKAKLSEDERKDAQILELQTSLRMRDAKDDVIAALEKEGAKATGLMWNAIKADLEFDDKGKLTNLKDLIRDLKADYADQFGEAKPTQTIEGGAGQQAGDKLTREKLAKMTPAEINALDWEEVKKVMASK